MTGSALTCDAKWGFGEGFWHRVLRDVKFEPKQLEKAIVAMRSNQLELTTLGKKPAIRRIV
jgi:hypothetical protein